MKKTAAVSSMRESSNEELKARIKRTEDELFQHRLKRYTNQLENTNLIRKSRRDIARAKTIMSQRAAGVEKGK
jgi:large subunit ribosomal protein L29